MIRYRLQYTANDIKERILRFMTTFNPSSETKTESAIELIVDNGQNENEPRERAFSQENLRND